MLEEENDEIGGQLDSLVFYSFQSSQHVHGLCNCILLNYVADILESVRLT